MNILGEGFHENIIKQIETRQKVYGSGYLNTQRTSEEILYLNANSAWCKLSSGTNIERPDALNIPSISQLGLTGPELAKKFILFNGTSYLDDQGRNIMRGGIDFNVWDEKSVSNNAYGIGGHKESGIKPMPGILSADISHENRGSIRKATIKLKAWNKFQLEIIDVLYLRLGFSVLLEWGNSMIFDNSYKLQTDVDYSLASDFLNGKWNYNTFLLRIDQQRILSQGNYDAMFGKVVNFSWSFLKDGSYDVTINLISSGDIIESLKANAINVDPLSTEALANNSEGGKEELPTESAELVKYFAKKNTIGYWLFQLWKLINDKTPPVKQLKAKTNDDCYTLSIPEITKETISESDRIAAEEKSTQEILDAAENPALLLTGVGALVVTTAAVYDYFTDYEINAPLANDFTAGYDKGYIDIINWEYDAWDSDGGDEQYYVRFGTFLAFIQNHLLPVCTGGEDNENGTPLLRIDYDTNSNIFALHPWQTGVDPRIAIIGRTIKFPESPEDLQNPENWVELIFNEHNSPIENEIIGDINGQKYGNIMNIYLNFNFILKKIDELKDDKGKLSLFDYIKALCEGMNEALGGLNNFEPIIDERTNQMKIIDQNPLPNRDEVIAKLKTSKEFNTKKLLEEVTDKLAVFDLYGYLTNEPDPANPVYNGAAHASFVRDFNFATEITPEYATMITVGASANGSVVGENSTALSKLNIGLKDRYKEEVLDREELKRRKEEQEKEREQTKQAIKEQREELKAMYERYYRTIDDYYDFLDDIQDDDMDINTDDIDTYKTTLKNLVDFNLQIKNKINNLADLDKKLRSDPEKEKEMAKGTGFIPFNLSLTINGLSGMKIYSKFTVDTRYLPTNYPERVEFLIKGVNHSISNNTWITKLESFCIAKGKFTDTEIPASSTSTTSTSTAAAPPSTQTQGLTSVNDSNLSNIRNAIVKIAKGYVNQAEIPENIVDGKNINDNKGFNDKSFEEKMKSVGWYSSNNALWCNWFADLVWKEAYTQVGANDSNIQNIFKTKLSLTVLPPLSAGVFKTLDAAVKKGFGKISPQLSDIKPGDMIIYNYGHVNICVGVNQQDGTISTVGGNEGGGSRSRNGGRVVYTAKKNFKTADIKGIVKVIE